MSLGNDDVLGNPVNTAMQKIITLNSSLNTDKHSNVQSSKGTKASEISHSIFSVLPNNDYNNFVEQSTLDTTQEFINDNNDANSNPNSDSALHAV